jgi:hypothetical protein
MSRMVWNALKSQRLAAMTDAERADDDQAYTEGRRAAEVGARIARRGRHCDALDTSARWSVMPVIRQVSP